MAEAIRTDRLTKHYGHTVALDSLDLEIDSGEVFGYLGPNGAGKSTTIGLLLGPDPTDVGQPRRSSASTSWRDAPDDPSAARLRPERSEPVAGAHRRGGAASSSANVHGSVDRGYRDELVDRFELVLDKKIRAYSHGNRQKVLLIAALASRAELLLLDEPTTGLDPLMEQVFRACVREARDRGQTVLLSSHILSEVEAVCDRVAMLRAGRIIETGRPRRAARPRRASTYGPSSTVAPPDLSSARRA